MKMFNLEATDMGSNQDEIADKALELITDKDFKTEDEFYDMECELIERACKELGWKSIPQTGGLIANWDSEDGEFKA